MRTFVIFISTAVIVLAADAEKKVSDQGKTHRLNQDSRPNFADDHFHYRSASHEVRDDERFQPEVNRDFERHPQTFREDRGEGHHHQLPQNHQHDFGYPNVHDVHHQQPFHEEHNNDESSAENEKNTKKAEQLTKKPSRPDSDDSYQTPEIVINGHKLEFPQIHSIPVSDVKTHSEDQNDEARPEKQEYEQETPDHGSHEDSDSEQPQPSIKYEQIPEPAIEKPKNKHVHKERKPERRPIYPSRGPQPVHLPERGPSFYRNAQEQNHNRHINHQNQHPLRNFNGKIPQFNGNHREAPSRYNIRPEQMQFHLVPQQSNPMPQQYRIKYRPRPEHHRDRQRVPNRQREKVLPQRPPYNPNLHPPQRHSNKPEAYHQSFQLPSPPRAYPPSPPPSPPPPPPPPPPPTPPPQYSSPQYQPPQYQPPQYQPPQHSPPSPNKHHFEIARPGPNYNNDYKPDVTHSDLKNRPSVPSFYHQKQIHNPVSNLEHHDTSSEDHRPRDYEEQKHDSSMQHASTNTGYNALPVHKEQYSSAPAYNGQYDGKTRTEISEFGYSVYHPSYTYSFSSYPSGYKLESNTLHDKGHPSSNAEYVHQPAVHEKHRNDDSGEYKRS